MSAERSSQSGVTLIEMLAALSVSALIGLAGFALLESVLQTEAGLADRLDQLVQQDHAFQLLALDLQHARQVERREDDGLTLHAGGQAIHWHGTPTGLQRHIVFKDRPDIVQSVLDEATLIGVERSPVALVTLHLPDHNVLRVFVAPSEVTP